MIPRAKPKRSYLRCLKVLSPVKAATSMGSKWKLFVAIQSRLYTWSFQYEHKFRLL